MSKKLTGNGLWESSRMMLPQHREAFVAQQKKVAPRIKPIIHEDEYELIVRYLKESFHTQKIITIEHFCEQQPDYVKGCVSRIDEQRQRVQMERDGVQTWLALSDITNVRNGTLD
jgi:hypothetical protein